MEIEETMKNTGQIRCKGRLSFKLIKINKRIYKVKQIKMKKGKNIYRKKDGELYSS